jgi:hypothetical protein
MLERRASRIQPYRKLLCLILTLCLSVAPVVAQDSSGDSESMSEDYNQVWQDGQADVAGNRVCVLSGLLLGLIGIILPWVINPKVPRARLIGNSVGYVQGYPWSVRRSVSSAATA